MSSMYSLIRLWRHTLIDGGCHKLLEDGVYSVHQVRHIIIDL
ncbi:unnamed protein product [Trichobilharzia regenti]|nr:unnamed protein product [Trichobilharzia regenti]